MSPGATMSRASTALRALLLPLPRARPAAAATAAATAAAGTRAANGLNAGRLALVSRRMGDLRGAAAVCAAGGAGASDGVVEVQLRVDGMVCDGCSSRVEETLAKMAGVKKVHVDLEKGLATIEVEAGSQTDALAAAEPLAEAVKGLGFEAALHFGQAEECLEDEGDGGTAKAVLTRAGWAQQVPRGHQMDLRLLLLLVAAAAVAAPAAAAPHWGPQWPWPDPAAPGARKRIDAGWQLTLDALWNHSRSTIGFCLGNSQYKAQRVLALSWPFPLPVSNDTSDALCSNTTRIDAHLCGPQEIEDYYKFMLLTEDLEKTPDNAWCSAAAGQPACSPGFFDANLDNRPGAGAPQQPHACCAGFFCPSELTCMIPCPMGSFCPLAWPAPPPDKFKGKGGAADASWCAPYAYKQRPDLGCGGADKWRIIPGAAFPATRWQAGSGGIYCDGGSYCPNTTSSERCPEGHFCRQGSVEPHRCPPGVACPEGTELPEQNYTGVTVDAALLCMLWLVLFLSRQYSRVLQHLSQKERLRIIWGAQPRITVVSATAARSAALSRPTSRNSHSRSHSLAGQVGGAAGGEAGADGGASGSATGLLRLVTRRGSRRGGGGAKVGQVWAAWTGPGGEGEGGYERLPEEGPPRVAGRPRRSASGGSSGGSDAVELSPPRRPLSAGGASPHARMSSVDCEEGLTPRHLHSIMVARQSQLLASPLGSVHAGTGTPLHVEFEGLGLRLHSCGKSVLAGVTAQLAASHTTAIMGPSGAGKTSLLLRLSGKAGAYGEQTGVVRVNGRPDKLERWRQVMGFVPQDDIMHSSLTVYENLLFSACYRLPARCTREQRLWHVERALSVLQLEDVRDELVGDEESRGISGGQKKRVNVGLELVADPLLLFLDEPTSGLDSSSSKALLAALQAVARDGVTCAAVIHQPSWESLLLFDDLLLLGKGGGVSGMFYGPVTGMQPYFEGLGFIFPLQQNPADACMDIVSGAALRPGQASAAELFDFWSDHCGHGGSAAQGLAASPSVDSLAGRNGAVLQRGRGDGSFELGVRKAHSSAVGLAGVNPSGSARADARRVTPGFWPQFVWCLGRAMAKRSRQPLAIFTNYCIIGLTGMTLGLISDRGRDTIMHFAVSITYSVVALGLMSTVGALGTFSTDRTVFFREAASGLNRTAFFLALDTFDHVSTVLRASVYFVMYYSFAGPRAVIWQMLLVSVFITYSCTGLAYLLSQVMEPAAAQLAAAVLALINTLIARQQHARGLVRLAQWTSFARWGLEGYVIAESNKLTGVWLLARCADLVGLEYDVRRFGACLLALGGLGLLFRAAALLAMISLHRDKQR
ncbi:ABC transporter G family member 28-like [Micractinium conductrix]|uniref:ABC transporter G family member 28-like n=1 Tax=Micractinium conductrix TaxID=554055 RepID=A0A2P6V1S5_9CHLO|nr:ABC transporter G family member 28-like [Micractinium conductrix]|eukprot:PSC68046.1 ABC transporter G family member 28-like [Micractinium conductrix]